VRSQIGARAHEQQPESSTGMTTGTTGYTVLTQTANTVAWLRLRKTLLGASEVACVLGLSQYKSRLAIYIDKLSDSTTEVFSERFDAGHRIEPVIADWIRDTKGMKVLPSPGLIRSNEFEWLGATPDRMNELGEPIELKTSDTWVKAEWTDSPPAAYVIQVLVQMICLGARRGYLGVLHGDFTFGFYTIEWDDEAVDQIIRLTRKFWTENVLAKIAPEPVTADEAALAFPNPKDISIDGGEKLLELHGAYGLMQAEQKHLEERLDAIKLELQKAMGEDATALTYTDTSLREPLVLFTWKPRKGPTRLDTAQLREDHPDLYESYLTEGRATRTFLRKTIKEIGA
jgi:putative phage-type endonuclease